MELTERNNEEMLECEVQDDDLLGMDLMELEAEGSSRAMAPRDGPLEAPKPNKKRRAGNIMNAPLGIRGRKIEFLRQGPPSSRSVKATRVAGKDRKHRHDASKSQDQLCPNLMV